MLLSELVRIIIYGEFGEGDVMRVNHVSFSMMVAYIFFQTNSYFLYDFYFGEFLPSTKK